MLATIERAGERVAATGSSMLVSAAREGEEVGWSKQSTTDLTFGSAIEQLRPREKGCLSLAVPVLCDTLLALSLLLVGAGARGDLIFSDSFDYPKGDLAGNGPPPGSPPGQGGWLNFNGDPMVAPSGLEFAGIFWAGRSASIHGLSGTTGDKAVAALAPVTAADGVVWVGFLMREARGSHIPDGFAVVSLGNDAAGPSLGIGLLFDKNRYGLDNNTGIGRSRSATTLPSRDTVWMVTKVDFSNAIEYLWVNPDPGIEPDIAEADAQLPMTSAFLASGFSEVVLKIGYTGAIFQFDELRVGTTFADVVSP